MMNWNDYSIIEIIKINIKLQIKIALKVFCDFNTLLIFSYQNYFETKLFKILTCVLLLKFSNTLKQMILNLYLFLNLNIHAE